MSFVHVVVNRFISDGDTTISTISVNGKPFPCFGLEDEHRDIKVAGETRIPAGIYPLELRKHGGFHSRYSAKFPWHKGMIEIANIPNFTDVLIHIGNTDEHTAGCLLVGKIANLAKMVVGNSTDAYRELYLEIIEAVEAGKGSIEFIDWDIAA